MTSPEPLRLTNPAELAALVPYLLGYQPTDGLAVLALRNQRVVLVAALPLSATTDLDAAVAHLAAVLASKNIDSVQLIGYGTHDPISLAVDQAAGALRLFGIAAPDAFRVADGRLWHLHCPDPRCAVGFPFDPSTTAAAAQATVSGLVVHRARRTLAAQLDPIAGAERDTMETALTAAMDQITSLVEGSVSPNDDPFNRLRELVDDLTGETINSYLRGDRQPDQRAALLLVLLTLDELRDVAIGHIHGDDALIRAWLDLTRRAGTTYAAGPATLLALAALQAGYGVLAVLAVHRALDADPEDALAQVLDEAIRFGIEPETMRRALHD
jgi:hypothetical protein